MGSKLLMLFLICSSSLSIAVCQNKEGPPDCMKSLIPCKPYLHGKEVPPPQCCVPLNHLMKSDIKCLCNIFNSPQILAGFNLTRDQAIKLPTHCDDKSDLSTCDKKDAATPASAPGSSSNTSAAASPAAGSGSGSAETSALSPAKMDNNGGDKMMMMVSGNGGLCFVGILSLTMMVVLV